MDAMRIAGPIDNSHNSDKPPIDDAHSPDARDGEHARNQESPRPKGTGDSARRRRKKAVPFVPSRHAILAFLGRLTQAVALGLMSEKKANSISGMLRLMLSHLPDGPGGATTNQFDAGSIQEALRTSPGLLDLLAPILSDDQLRELSDREENHGADDPEDQVDGT